MRRIVGIIILAIGGLLLASRFVLKVEEIGLGFSIGIIISGLAIFSLSFIPYTEPGPDAPPPLPPAGRVTRVFYEPEPVFKNLRYHPRWLAGFLVLAVVMGIYTVATTQQLGLGKIASDFTERMIASGRIPEDKVEPYRAQQAAEAAKQGVVTKIILPLSSINFLFIVMLILAGLYLLCVLAFGGRMDFWQALAVAVYGTLPATVVERILSLVLLYVTPFDKLEAIRVQRGLARADLGILLKATTPENPYLLVHPYLYTLASFIGLFTLYRWWVTVAGLRNTSAKLSAGSAWTIAFLLWLLGLLLSLLLPVVASSFVE